MLQVLKTRTERYKVGSETFLSVPRLDTVKSSNFRLSQSAREREKVSSRLSVEYTLSTVWERFWKAIRDTCGRPLIKCFDSKYVKGMLFHFPMNVVLFQRIWSFSFNRFASLNQIHRMANQVGDKSPRCLIFTVFEFHEFLLFLIQFELSDSENYHSQLKSRLPKMQKRDLARVSIRRQTYYS